MTRVVGPRLRLRVIVCGNTDRGDDGVAAAAVEELLPALDRPLEATIDVRLVNELRVEDLVDLPSESGCLIVDAVAGVEPGRVVRLPLQALGVPLGFTPRSSHQLPIDLVIGLAGVLRDRPVEGTFIGLGGDAFGYGTPMSAVVRAAIPAFGDAIEHEIHELLRAQEALA